MPDPSGRIYICNTSPLFYTKATEKQAPVSNKTKVLYNRAAMCYTIDRSK